VDTPELVRDPLLSTLGAREKVNYIVDSLSALHTKIAGLVDREWDGFCTITRTRTGSIFTSPTNGIYRTIGHSIENYLIEFEMYVDYIKKSYSHAVSIDFLEDVTRAFPAALLFSYAYSVACQQASCISRCDRLLSSSHIGLEGGRFCLNDQFLDDLRSRGIPELDLNRFEEIFKSISEMPMPKTSTDAADLKWNSHGHLGQSAVWVCIAHVAKQNGFSAIEVTEIERGRRNEKLQHFAHMLAKDGSFERIPLESLVQWATS